MMALKPWYKVVEPRGDFRQGLPLDAAKFAVLLKHRVFAYCLVDELTEVGLEDIGGEKKGLGF